MFPPALALAPTHAHKQTNTPRALIFQVSGPPADPRHSAFDIDVTLGMDAIVCFGPDAHNKCADECRDPEQFTDAETGDVGYKCEINKGTAILLQVGFAGE